MKNCIHRSLGNGLFFSYGARSYAKSERTKVSEKNNKTGKIVALVSPEIEQSLNTAWQLKKSEQLDEAGNLLLDLARTHTNVAAVQFFAGQFLTVTDWMICHLRPLRTLFLWTPILSNTGVRLGCIWAVLAKHKPVLAPVKKRLGCVHGT